MGHSYRTAQSIAFRFSELKAFHASMKSNTQSSSWECCNHRRCIAWTPPTPPSIPAYTPPARCFVLQAALASCPITLRTHFDMSRCQVYPNPIGLTPGFLSSENLYLNFKGVGSVDEFQCLPVNQREVSDVSFICLIYLVDGAFSLYAFMLWGYNHRMASK